MNNQSKFMGIVVSMALLLVCVVAVSSSIAATNPPWYDVSVDEAGVVQGAKTPLFIMILTDQNTPPAFTSRWFKVDPIIGNQVLAAALTAQATGKNATVYLSDTTAGTVLPRFYLKK